MIASEVGDADRVEELSRGGLVHAGENGEPQSVRELAASGLGLGLLMAIDGDRDPRLTRVSAWPGDSPPGSLWLLVHPDVSRARRVRVVADCLYDHLRSCKEAFIEPREPSA